MNIKSTLVQHLKSHSVTGTWTGAVHDGKPVISISGEFVSAVPYLTLLGIKLHNSNKYRGIQNEDLGQPQLGGDSPELGDGTSQSAE
jgi:hypothetical protein